MLGWVVTLLLILLLSLAFALEVEIPFARVGSLVVVHGWVVRAGHDLCCEQVGMKSVNGFAFGWSGWRLFCKLEAAGWQSGE